MLSDDALNALAEIEQDARDLAAWSPEEIAAYEAWMEQHAGDNPEGDTCTLADWHAAGEYLSGATHDAAGFPLCDTYPW